MSAPETLRKRRRDHSDSESESSMQKSGEKLGLTGPAEAETDDENSTDDSLVMDAVEALGKLKNAPVPEPPKYQQKFFNTVTNYYNSSKEYLPTFRVLAEFVEKRAAPIVRRFEQKFPANRKTMKYLHNQQQKLQQLNLNVSIESKKNLKTLLRFVRLANDRLSLGVDNLQNLLSEKEKKLGLDPQRSNKSEGLQHVKKDIVLTVKKAVMMISKVAGNSLPEPAKAHVRDVLLKLPENLLKALKTDIEEFSTPMGSPMRQSDLEESLRLENKENARFLNQTMANKKILILAKESLDSFANIIKIFDQNILKMDEWVEAGKQKEIDKLRKMSRQD